MYICNKEQILSYMRKQTWPFDNIPSLFTTKATRLGVISLSFYRFYSPFVFHFLCLSFRVNVMLVVRCENENSRRVKFTKTRYFATTFLFLLEWYTDLYVWRASKNMNMNAVV